ncbi:hypothetical protein EJ06DRAFT_470475 [Trichodelitschia bisporula]|uniref:Myb-like domain-containing protein n=1 Tax=Trichodelitschia bisporula TaxID=703511 RepID=A0A6G1I7T4_9PEZI|nr:hypothetical protein EJ06DRAFT_470475 [Trichodelitschia bisporula]
MPTPPPHPHGASTPVRRPYAPIAPHPVGLRQLAKKRTLSCTLSDDEWEAAAVVAAVTGGSPPPTKRLRRSAPASPNIEMTEEDTFLLRLKDEEGLTWKEIATRFHTELGKSFQVPALQMRLKRLRERMRIWTEGDIQALRMAHEFWMSQKWDVIAGKPQMTEFGATEKWSPKQCSRKWQELSFAGDLFAQQMMRTPTFSTTYTASPIEGSLPSFYPALAITTS